MVSNRQKTVSGYSGPTERKISDIVPVEMIISYPSSAVSMREASIFATSFVPSPSTISICSPHSASSFSIAAQAISTVPLSPRGPGKTAATRRLLISLGSAASSSGLSSLFSTFSPALLLAGLLLSFWELLLPPQPANSARISERDSRMAISFFIFVPPNHDGVSGKPPRSLLPARKR